MHLRVTRVLSLRFTQIRIPFALALLCILSLGARTTYAEDAAKPADPSKPSAPGLTDVLTASGIDLHGYVDVAYT